MIRSRLHILAVLFIMTLLSSALMIWTTNTYRSNLREELTLKSSTHELLVPAYLDCRSGLLDDTPVATCLVEASSLAEKLGLTNDWANIRQDIMAYEIAPKNGISLLFSMLSDAG